MPFPHTHSAARPPHVTGDRHVILLAEDDGMLREYLSRVLRSAGHTVLEAADGAEALRTSRVYAPEIDVLLTDFDMPKLNGVDLAAAVTREHPGTKVLIVSGQACRVALETAWETLQKPFLPDVLFHRIDALFQEAA